MKTLIIIFLVSTVFLIADSTKVNMTVTFYDVSLKQAVEIEEILQDEFEGYNYSVEVNKTIPSSDYLQFPQFRYNNIPYLKDGVYVGVGGWMTTNCRTISEPNPPLLDGTFNE